MNNSKHADLFEVVTAKKVVANRICFLFNLNTKGDFEQNGNCMLELGSGTLCYRYVQWSCNVILWCDTSSFFTSFNALLWTPYKAVLPLSMTILHGYLPSDTFRWSPNIFTQPASSFTIIPHVFSGYLLYGTGEHTKHEPGCASGSYILQLWYRIHQRRLQKLPVRTIILPDILDRYSWYSKVNLIYLICFVRTDVITNICLHRENVFQKRLDVQVGGVQVMAKATQKPEDVS